MPVLPPPFYARLHNFRQADYAGQDLDVAWIDAELDRILISLNRTVAMLRGVTDASGRLILQQPLREMELIETIKFTATAGQTQFYLVPVLDALTVKAQFQVQVGSSSLYQVLDQSLVSVAAAVAAGTVTAAPASNTYVFSVTVPLPVVGATLTINGVNAGTVLSRPTSNTVITTVPWPNAGAVVAAPSWAWGSLALATISGITLAAGQLVQVAIYSDGSGALTQLGNASVSTGAVQVALNDAAGIIAATNVEDAIAEIENQILTLLSDLGPINDLYKRNGSLPLTGDMDAGGFNLTNIAPASAAGHAVEYSQFAAFVGIWNNLQQFFLKLDGSSFMGGNLNMGGKKIVSQADGTDPTDGINLQQLGTRLNLDGTSPMTGDLNMNSHKILAVTAAVADTDAPNWGQTKALVGVDRTPYVFATPGPVSHAIPSGIKTVKVRMWGGGGGGQQTNGLGNNLYGGGAAGAYLESSLTIDPAGETLTLTIGAGGLADLAGGDTTITQAATVVLRAGGGFGGSNLVAPAIGGVPVSPGALPFVGLNGGNGSPGYHTPAVQVAGGQGGSAPMGGAGGWGHLADGSGNLQPGSAGQQPGGGGGGGPLGFNGVGGAGMIVLEY